MKGELRPDEEVLTISGKTFTESFPENLSVELNGPYMIIPDLPERGTFEESGILGENDCGFPGADSLPGTLCTESGCAFSNGFFPAAGGTASGNPSFARRKEFPDDFKEVRMETDSEYSGYPGYSDSFMKRTFSKSSNFAFGFPMIFIGAEAFQLSRAVGFSLATLGIMLLGLGQYYRENPEGLDG